MVFLSSLDSQGEFFLSVDINYSTSSATEELAPYVVTLRCKDPRSTKTRELGAH